MIQGKVFKIIPRVQHYLWGGISYIPDLLKEDNKDEKPFAELWMGTHALCPSWIEKENDSLTSYISNHREEVLGEKVAREFGELPYLFKLLDVKEMLSIQVHPTKQQANEGFEAEEKAGISIDAHTRNYKDRNHKPEAMIALSDFWLLHGFKDEQHLLETLERYPGFFELVSIFRQKGYDGLYSYVMNMPQEEVNSTLTPIITEELKKLEKNALDFSDAGWWVSQLYKGKTELGDVDRGVFSIYFFNLVHMKRGDSIFQAAGIPHAYLMGQNIEVMANSDNVIRGGLTNKHVDVKELVRLTSCQPVKPHIFRGYPAKDGIETIYSFPVKEFAISHITLANNQLYQHESNSLEEILVLRGKVKVNGSQVFRQGEVIGIVANCRYDIEAIDTAELYKAYVPL